MLRLAVIIKRFIATGGAERHAVELTRRLAERGHAIDLYCRTADENLCSGLNLHIIPDRWRFSSVLNSLAFASDVAKALSGRAYDVIHSNERGFRQDILTIHCFSYKGSQSGLSPFRKITRLYLSPRSLLYLWLEKKQMQTPAFAAVSELIKDDISKYYGVQASTTVITPGVDADYFHPADSDYRMRMREKIGIPEGDIAIAFIGSEFRRKGLDDLIPVISPPLRLIVIGKGDHLSHYKRMLDRLKSTDRVHFLGLCKDVRPYLAASDIVALPSRSDAFGMSVLEAMACARPVVVSKSAGASMLIENSVNGFVFKDQKELKGILPALRDSGLREAVGRRARITAENHSWDKTTDRYERLFFRIARMKGRPIEDTPDRSDI